MCYKKDLFPSFFYTILFDFITKFENFNNFSCWALFIDASGSRLKKIERPWSSRRSVVVAIWWAVAGVVESASRMRVWMARIFEAAFLPASTPGWWYALMWMNEA